MGKQICFDKVGGFGLKTRSCTLLWLIYFNSKKMFFMSLIFVINLAKIFTINLYRKFNLIINKLPKFYKINISIYIYLRNSFIRGDIYIYIYIVRQITTPIRIFRKIDNFKKNNLNYWFTTIFINCIYISNNLIYLYISIFLLYEIFPCY